MRLPVIPADKANHFLYGALIGIVVKLVCTFFGVGPVSLLLMLAAGGIIGFLKEVLDYRANKKAQAAGQAAPHGVERLDMLWTLYGSMAVTFTAFLEQGPPWTII